jgi:hypothetical protein
MKLSNGIVIPSYLGVQSSGYAQDTGVLTNLGFRLGEVKAIIYPDSPKSLSKKYTEYDVQVHHQDGHSAGTSVLYSNCLISNVFGSGGDILRYTLRPSENATENKVGLGAKVLILCVNGDSTRAVIISGIRDRDTDFIKDSKDDGHHLLFEFNGLNANINKDGEFNLKFRGATTVAGKLGKDTKEENGGALFSFLKDGTASLADGGKGEERLELDLQNKQVRLSSAGTTIINCPDGMDVNSNKKINLNASNVYIGSSGASQALVHGTDWRKAEQAKDQDLITELTQMAATLAALAITHTVAGAALTGAAVPLMVPIGGPMVASPMIGAAGAAITSMTASITKLATSVAKMMAAITTYEAKQSSYLSTKNFTD